MAETGERRYDDQMMLIDRSSKCEELRSIASELGLKHAELLRQITDAALPGLRRTVAAKRREAKRRAVRETLEAHTA